MDPARPSLELPRSLANEHVLPAAAVVSARTTPWPAASASPWRSASHRMGSPPSASTPTAIPSRGRSRRLAGRPGLCRLPRRCGPAPRPSMCSVSSLLLLDRSRPGC